MVSEKMPDQRRVIGPVPPRGPDGRMLIAPVLGKQIRKNVLGEPLRDKEGNPLEEVIDTRPAIEYMAFDGTQRPTEEAVKGLRKYRVDVGDFPILIVYARDENHAMEVYKKEWGVLRLDQDTPYKITLEK